MQATLSTVFKGIFVAALTLGLAPTSTSANEFPSKSLSYIIPFGPGGESDISARHQQPLRGPRRHEAAQEGQGLATAPRSGG